MSNIMSINAISEDWMSIYELTVDKMSCAKMSDDEMFVCKNVMQSSLDM